MSELARRGVFHIVRQDRVSVYLPMHMQVCLRKARHSKWLSSDWSNPSLSRARPVWPDNSQDAVSTRNSGKRCVSMDSRHVIQLHNKNSRLNLYRIAYSTSLRASLLSISFFGPFCVYGHFSHSGLDAVVDAELLCQEVVRRSFAYHQTVSDCCNRRLGSLHDACGLRTVMSSLHWLELIISGFEV